MDRKIRVKVPIVTTGMAKGVELGGVLQIIRREIEVLCLPFEVPESFEIDVADLDIGDSIHVRDISQEGEIEFLEDENFTVVTLLIPKIEEEEEPAEEEEEEAEEAAVEGEVEEAPKADDEG
jgi:large subunit ribosomal protein L25